MIWVWLILWFCVTCVLSVATGKFLKKTLNPPVLEWQCSYCSFYVAAHHERTLEVVRVEHLHYDHWAPFE